MKRRKWTEAQKAAAISFFNINGRTATLKKFRLSSSVLHSWVNAKPPEKQVKTAGRVAKSSGTMDALIYLEHAEREILNGIKAGVIVRINGAHLLTLLALEQLRGGGGK